jgi:two-component system OmpR family sensor kinase
MHEKLVERWNAISLRTKVTSVSVFLLTVGLIVAGFGSMSVLRGSLTEAVDQRITTASESLSSDVLHFSPDGTACSFEPSQPTDYVFMIFDSAGDLMCANQDEASALPDLGSMSRAYAESHHYPQTFEAMRGNAEFRVVPVVLEVTLGSAQFVVSAVVGLNLVETNSTIGKFAAIFLFFGLTVVVLGAALTRLLVTSTFAPLREVEATAARFAAGDFNQRLAGATPNTEVGRLNRSLNSMLNRIDRAFADRARTIEQMRRFVGDASHELRTPLVSVRGYAELYRMGALQDEAAVAQAMERIEKEAIRMAGLVEDLLELARIDEAKPLVLAEVDLVLIARDAALDAMASQPDREVSVVVDNEPSEVDDAEHTTTDALDGERPAASATGPVRFAGAIARLRGRRGRAAIAAPEPAQPLTPLIAASSAKVMIIAEENKIRQVVTNLMGNALRFTPPDSPIEIGIGRDDAHATASISIIDHGEGIPPQLREKIFQRFWRADTSRTRDTGGSGLGLAIVASIVSTHRGRIEVLETPGGGATFRVVLPLLPIPTQPAPSTES